MEEGEEERREAWGKRREEHLSFDAPRFVLSVWLSVCLNIHEFMCVRWGFSLSLSITNEFLLQEKQRSSEDKPSFLLVPCVCVSFMRQIARRRKCKKQRSSEDEPSFLLFPCVCVLFMRQIARGRECVCVTSLCASQCIASDSA